MSEEMELYFKLKFPELDILYIPHGIDTSFFIPKETKKDQILLIGSWLRDFEFASKVFFRLELELPEVSIKIVTNKLNHKYFFDNNVECFYGIDDDTLLTLYQNSKIIFLPLKEFTANNAILEGLSCGCETIISSTLSSSKSNVFEKSPVILINDNIEDVVDILVSCINNWNETKIFNNRSFVVENFDWSLISKKTNSFLLN